MSVYLQVDAVLQYTAQASLYDLGEAEQLLAQLALVPDYRCQLQAAVLHDDIDRRVRQLQATVDAVTTAASDVINSHRLQQFMMMAVDAVNFLNMVRYCRVLCVSLSSVVVAPSVVFISTARYNFYMQLRVSSLREAIFQRCVG